MRYGQEKLDHSIVAMKAANNRAQSHAESLEPREGAEGNTGEPRTSRTPSREIMPHGLDRVWQAAKERKKEQFTALLHHVDVDLFRSAYFWLKWNATPGIYGVTWGDYEQNLEASLVDLHARIHRGSYRELSIRRKYLPKPEGQQRPLGIASQEDKIVQRAVVEVLNAIYEKANCKVVFRALAQWIRRRLRAK